jgi:hypothetical protein
MDIGRVIAQQLSADPGIPLKLAYHLNLTGWRFANSLKVDVFRAGVIEFVDSGVAGSDPEHSFEYKLFYRDGLRVSIVRPVGATVNIGEWAAFPLRLSPEELPDSFLLVAAFNRPRQTPIGDQFIDGSFAPSLLMASGGSVMGVTSQFRVDGVRMNLPGTGVTPNRPVIDQSFTDRIMGKPPSPITLALLVDRTADPVSGIGYFYVGDERADSYRFNFVNFTSVSAIRDVRAGIGTASGEGYRASVYLLDFQIWVNQSYAPPIQL